MYALTPLRLNGVMEGKNVPWWPYYMAQKISTTIDALFLILSTVSQQDNATQNVNQLHFAHLAINKRVDHCLQMKNISTWYVRALYQLLMCMNTYLKYVLVTASLEYLQHSFNNTEQVLAKILEISSCDDIQEQLINLTYRYLVIFFSTIFYGKWYVSNLNIPMIDPPNTHNSLSRNDFLISSIYDP